MNSDSWEIVERLFHSARDLAAEERAAFLDRECGADTALRRTLDRLLEQDENVQDLLSKPAVDMVAMRLPPGTRVGPYEVIAPIGAGGMGEVYRAQDTRLKRDVAIKALPAEFANNADRRARFEREATLLAALNHPNIAAIYDVVERSGHLYLVLEFVEGATLAARLLDGPLPFQEVLPIAHQMALALEAAHARGVAHRDLKPANIMVMSDGRVKVLDFSLANGFTKTAARSLSQDKDAAMSGTPAYMSPEQLRRRDVDSRTDIWAFGVVLYEMLTGHKPFEAKTLADTSAAILSLEPNLTLPEPTPADLKHLLVSCLQKEPDRRIQTFAEISRQIVEIQKVAAETVITNLRDDEKGRPVREPNPSTPAARADKFDLVVNEVHKAYVRRREVLSGVNLIVPKGAVTGLLGRNGCGKTTLIRIIMGAIVQDSGRVVLFGRSLNSARGELLSRIGYVPETFYGYDQLSVGELLRFVSRFYPRWDQARCYKLLGRFDLPLNNKVRDLAKGMRTKVSLVAALSHRPELLIMDDPTLGLDAVVLQEVFETIHELSEQDGTTVLIASHNLEEVEKVATHLAILADRRILIADTLQAVKDRTRHVSLVLGTEMSRPPLIEHFQLLQFSGNKMAGIVLDTSSNAIEQLRALRPQRFTISELSLKEIFVNLTRPVSD